MKKEWLLWTGFGLGIIVSLWICIDFQQTQKGKFLKSLSTFNNLKINLNALKDDLRFLKANQKKINFLVSKGWMIPHSRLIASETIENLKGNLNEIHYTFEPETIKNLETNHIYKITKIVIDVGALLESDIYAFVENMLEDFPGILILHELMLAREEEVNSMTLSAHNVPNFVVGHIIFEWFSIGEKDHED